MPEFMELTRTEDLHLVRDIADKIWPETFRNILSPEQIRYMMHMMYAPDVMADELANGFHFEILVLDGTPAGYISWSPWKESPGTAKLHKVYLLSQYHHKGFGRLMLDHAADRCRAAGFTRLILSVNKENAHAYNTYLRNGYTVFESVKIDIGGGFYMDDFRMERPLSTLQTPHSNIIRKGNTLMKHERIAAFGEVMLRLCPPEKKRFAQVLPGSLEASFGGGEANVCASIAMMGGDSRYLTALPDNPIARAFMAQQRGFGTDVSKIHLEKSGRMGVYYAEHGAAQRGSNVVYDRAGAVISLLGPDAYDFDSMLDGCTHLHVTGITPALSENAYLTTLEMVKRASDKGIRISCDLNFRKKLWDWKAGVSKKELANECMSNIVAYADIIIGNEEDAADVFGIVSEGSSVESGKINIAGYQDVAKKLALRFPKVSFVAITLRESISADHNNWGGMLFDKASGKAFFAPLNEQGEYTPYEIRDIIDRFGGGDSFCAGLIFALTGDEFQAPADAIRYAVAASCLKHSIPGDYNFSSKDEIVNLMKGNASGRVKR